MIIPESIETVINDAGKITFIIIAGIIFFAIFVGIISEIGNLFKHWRRNRKITRL